MQRSERAVSSGRQSLSASEKDGGNNAMRPRRACFWLITLFSPAVLLMSGQNIPAKPEYAQVANTISTEIRQQMKEKRLPAMAIAIVDGRNTVWAEGFGFEDAHNQRPATAHTIFRVGSVSKLFTDIAVMRLVERGKLDLDAPVTRYIPEFHPSNPFGGEITLRQLMSHRSGLLREPVVGHYFDNSAPSLQQTVLSLNGTELVFAPGTHTKYSNAGIAVVGYVVQKVGGQDFAEYLKQSLLRPLQMNESAFTLEPRLIPRMAEGRMWSYDGLDFAAPTFPLGEASAGAMYTSVSDLGRFLSVLFAGGQSGNFQMLSSTTLDSMWKPQFGGSFGLGFALGSLDGHRLVGHNGAIYGFATELSALPDDKLGVVVVTNVDGANAVSHHIAQNALRQMLALRSHTPTASPQRTTAVDLNMARSVAGSYAGDKDTLALDEQEGDLVLSKASGGYQAGLKQLDGHLVQDSRLIYSTTPVVAENNKVTIGTAAYVRTNGEIPPPVRPEWSEFIGEYGWDYDKFYVLEDYGKLRVLAEWFDFEPMEQLSHDQFQLPDRGLYQSEKVTFQRDASGAVKAVQVGNVVFPRLPLNKPGQIFQITPIKPVPELRREALASKPPVEAGTFLEPNLVEVRSIDPTIRLDVRYASNRNFLSAPLYLQERAFMQRPAAEALARVSAHLHTLGYGLLIHDAYRPWYVTKMFWEGTPEDKRIFVADPSQGSRHNRGCAVDLTLYDLKGGEPIEMTGGYDEMSERSYPFYPGGTARQRWTLNLLRYAMEQERFNVFEYEWWHFDYKDWRKYPILNLTFEQLDEKNHLPAQAVQ
jgi:CubicO group peptidase (beta-lactamase class C family)/D-alanyl-D-alanine dipeptidase